MRRHYLFEDMPVNSLSYTGITDLLVETSVPDMNVQQKLLRVMVHHHEGVIIEDCSIVNIGDGDQVPDNVREQVMRPSNLDQVLCLLRSQFFPLTKFKNINHLKLYYRNIT